MLRTTYVSLFVVSLTLVATESYAIFPPLYPWGGTMIPGDFNGDGSVDLIDLDIIGTNFGVSPATFEMGDANGDNRVDLLDFDVYGLNFGATAPTPASAIPEPTSGVLLMLGLTSMALKRRMA